ncbi:MAG: AAA family ATPase [Clostridia bacterium]|nr:AAA family ATPase [Clostridia bacterium]
MKITKMEINNYKSIKEPIEINFYDTLPTVLIGKNGSGKTNILEALDAIAQANSNYYGLSKELSLNYKVHICLSKDDIARLFPGKSIDEEKCRFIAYSGENCKIDRIESEYLVPLLNSEICEIYDLANELKKALNTYIKQLNKIAYNGRDEIPVRGFQITDFRNSTTDFESLKFQMEFVIEEAEKLADSLMQSFESNENSFRFGYVYNYFSENDAKKLSFQLRYIEPDLASFEKKFITVNRTAIKREITKINKATKASCNRIIELLNEIDECAKRLKAALTGTQLIPGNNGTFYEFIREVQNCVGSKFSFLRNESSDVIFRSNEREQEYYRNDKSILVLLTYINKVYSGADKEDLLNKIQVEKDFSLSDAALSEFEEYLNSDIPDFEEGMYDRISVERAGKIPAILLHEKSGDTVALSSTSAGRRWYFTYYFMKNTLQPGDLFIIDEPAAMLHPTAQKEVMRELLDLEKNGIKVVYSTHSPYLIPSDWQSVQFVSMEENGTVVTQENCTDLLKQVIGGDIFNLQEILEKYQKGDKELIANRCYQAVIDYYQSIKKYKRDPRKPIEIAANELNVGVDTVVSWRKKKSSKHSRCPELENIITIATKTNSDIFELL